MDKWKIALLSIALLAMIPSAPCQTQTTLWAYQIEAVNRDVREVLDDLFQKAGKQYVLEPGVEGNVSLRIATNSFEEALHRVLQSAGLTYHVERSSSAQGRLQETYVVRARAASPLLSAQAPIDILSRPVNLVASTSLRNVLNMLSRQAGVSITAAREVPDLQVTRLVLSNVSLGYALNLITQATRTQYQFQPDGSILLVPAPQIQVREAPSAPASARQLVDPTIQRTPLQQGEVAALKRAVPPPLTSLQPALKCSCGAELQAHWNFCPMCGKRIPKPATPPRR
ncbi:MAG: hypothetical protein RMK92_04850 [Armatimonadota bacterium]|nr:hypothetical protein [Armatimonadota bacterium]